LSGVAYTLADREFLSAVASTVGLAFDSLKLRASHVTPTAEPAARECDGCGSVYGSEMGRCRCGRALSDGAVPYVLRGVFRFERRIGAGGSGVVYRAVDLGLGRTVAIKLLSAARAEHVDALIREARHMAGVSHRHLAVIHGVERWRNAPLLVQEYLEGGTVAMRLLAGAMTHDDIVELGTVLVDVLEQLHREGVVHCDVKPSNIGYTREGVIKLFDFSLARHMQGAPADVSGASGDQPKSLLDSVGNLAGTPFYMSPEAIRGVPPEPGFDWWALSVVLFEALAGRRPFDGADTPDVLASILFRPAPSLRQFRPDLPDEVSNFFTAALDQMPSRRPATGAAFRSAVESLRGARPH
jgi:serine/threonine protein kinase